MDINKIRKIILNGTIEHLKFVLENYNFDINEKDNNNDTILNLLVKNRFYEINKETYFREKLCLLLSHPNINVNITNGTSNPISMMSNISTYKYENEIKMLIKHKSFDVNYKISANNRRTLDYIIDMGHDILFDYLLEIENIDINYIYYSYQDINCPLFNTIKFNRPYMFNKLFLHKNIDLSILEKILDNNRLLETIYYKSYNTLSRCEQWEHNFKLLIKTNKININTQNKDNGQTILHKLLYELSKKINSNNYKSLFEYIKIILERKDIDLKLKDNKNNSIIDYVLLNKNEELLDLFGKYIPINPILVYV